MASNLTDSPTLRKSYTSKFKRDVVDHHNKNGNTIVRTAWEFGINESLVSRWLNLPISYFSKDQLNSKRVGAGRSAAYPELENKLYDSIVKLREKGAVIRYSKVRQLAKNIVTRNQIDIGDLKMSDNWIYRFCQRKGFSDRVKTHTAQDCKLSEMDQCIIVTDFLFSVRCVKFNYQPCFILNMDETPVYMDMPGNRTLHFKGSKTVDVAHTGHEKSRFTVTLTISADGDILPAFVIFKNLKKIPKVIISKNS
jgi:transposase-like protein